MERSHGEEGVEGNAGKAKVMICCMGVGNNSIYCNGCKLGA